MKTYKNLFPKIVSWENLVSAFGKTYRGQKNSAIANAFHFNLEEELLKLQKELESQTYKPDRYRQFWAFDPKRRLISAPSFRDRVVHHALCNIITPIFDKTFIFDSYACREGKGTHKAIERLTKFMKAASLRSKGKVYALKCDVKKYFASVDQSIVFSLVKRKIADSRVLWLIKLILGSSEDGIPIGNLTSQLFANVYLNELDHFVKDDLRVKFYLRYVDDFIILDCSKEKLHQIKKEVVDFLATLKLELHTKKIRVFPVSKGVDFLGFVNFLTHRKLRKRNVVCFKRRLKRMVWLSKEGKISEERVLRSVQSWLAHAKHANTYKLRERVLGEGVGIQSKRSR